MRLSISARIFGGFLVVLLAFGGVMGYTVLSLHRLRRDLHLLSTSYLSQTLILAELHTIQGSLVKTLEETSAGRTQGKFLRTQVRAARLYQLEQVQTALRVVRRGAALDPRPEDLSFLKEVERRLLELHSGFRLNQATFDDLSSAEREGAASQVEEVLMREERRLATLVHRLREDVRAKVRATAPRVEQEENRVILAILAMVVVALLVSAVVTFGVQLTLRPLRWLVTGTKRIGSGDYANRVEVNSGDELGTLAAEFNSMAAAIEEREQRLIRSERMATVGRIAAHVTHEIRNPLSSISLNTELLEEELIEAQGMEQAAESRVLLAAIQKEVDRLTDFTEEYLRFARLPRPHLEEEDLQVVLLDLLTFMGTELADMGVTVEQTLQPGVTSVRADENQLRQALLNLLRNAGEAMTAQGGTLKISTRHDGDQVELRLEDSGPGITPEDQKRIFEPFFSTKETGTGLGLALTQQIFLEHGGTIEVESVEGEGTCFVVRLPLA
mgnify:CR=1 FL=1